MRIKSHLSTFVLAMLAWLTGCVSPFYSTAKIERGLTVNAGLSLAAYHVPITAGPSYSIGVRGDAAAGYGFSSYLRLNARASLGLGTQFSGMHYPFFADGAVGAQTAASLGAITPALHVELSGYLGEITLSPALLLGIGRKEYLTFGARMHAHDFWHGWDPVAVDAFACVHLSPRWSIFAGVEIFYLTYAPAVTLGAGYNVAFK